MNQHCCWMSILLIFGQRHAPDDFAVAIQALIEKGDRFLDADDFGRAATLYREAIRLIPEPKHGNDLALPAWTALGEALFHAGEMAQALPCFRFAITCPDGTLNLLVHLRIGQTLFELGEFRPAADAFTRADALAGPGIFDGEDNKYLSFLSTRIDLEPRQ